MWNSIQARHPEEAAHLSKSPAVISFDPASPPQPTAQPRTEQQSSQQAQSDQGFQDQLTAFTTVHLLPGLPPSQRQNEGLPLSSASVESGSVRRNIFSRLAGLALLVPHSTATESTSVQQAQHEAATASNPVSASSAAVLSAHGTTSAPASSVSHTSASMGSSASRASETMHAGEVRRDRASVMHTGAETAYQSAHQPEVLRRAQAAFSDLRDIRVRSHQAAVSLAML